MTKLTLVALNEFSVEFLSFAEANAKFPNIQKLLSSKYSETWTEDAVERHDLDPWVQWVSIHTGIDSSCHGIRHLGDVPNLAIKQLWETMSLHGYSSGIWGAMNASRGEADRCQFFLPDPWTFSESAYPKSLNGLLALPRYYAKNYLDTRVSKLLKAIGSLIIYLLGEPRLIFKLLSVMPLSFKGVFQFGLKNHVLFSIFDLFSTVAFLHYKKQRDPDFCMIFINSMAHVQHNIWSEGGELKADCVYTLEVIENILQRINGETLGEEVVIMNALTQTNIAGVEREVLYRQINPDKFLTAMNIRHSKVEQLMTNDGHIFFDSLDDARAAKQVLEEATIGSKLMFDVEYSESTPKKLFFQFDIWDEIEPGALFYLGGKSHLFYHHFEAVVARTGKHSQRGDVYCNLMNLPKKLVNHEIHKHILKYFNIKLANKDQDAPIGTNCVN